LPEDIDWTSEGVVSSLKIIFDAAINTAFPQCKMMKVVLIMMMMMMMIRIMRM